MNGTIANIALVVLFVLVGSMFAAAEMSLVSLRDSQVRAMATRGGAARPSPGSPRTRTGSWPRCRWA